MMGVNQLAQLSASHINTFDRDTTATIAEMLAAQQIRLAQLDRLPKDRSLTARNYGSAIIALGGYMAQNGAPLPTKSLLTSWRDDMLSGRATKNGKPASTSTVNSRLSAARKLLRGVADDVTDITVKTVLNNWATVEDAKKTALDDADKTESDYGRRFTLEAVEKLIKSIPTNHLKGLRDRAMIAVMVGAGLRVSEVSNLTLRDMFGAVNEQGQRGIKVRRGKHNKTRVIVLNGWNSWVIQAVQAYTDTIGLTLLEHGDQRVFRG